MGPRRVMVGVGSTGCAIAAALSRMDFGLRDFLLVSCDPEDLSRPSDALKLPLELDLRNGGSIGHVRAQVNRYREELLAWMKGAEVVFTLAGLGGLVGSAVAPIVSGLAKSVGATSVGLVVMPFRFEKDRHFRAAVALRRIREAADGCIVIDSDGFLDEMPRTPPKTALEMVCRGVVEALTQLLRAPSEREAVIEFRKFLETVRSEGYCVLTMGKTDRRAAQDAVTKAVEKAGPTAPAQEAEAATLYLASKRSVLLGELATAVNQTRTLLGRDGVRVYYGWRLGGYDGVSACLLSSGYRRTRYDSYDPLYQLLGDRQLDDEPEMALPVEFPRLTRLD